MKEAIDKAKALQKRIREGGTQKYAGLDRQTTLECIRSFQRLGDMTKRFKSTKEVSRELRTNGPAWFGEIAGLLDDMKHLLKKTQEKKFYAEKKQSPPPRRWKVGSEIRAR